MIEQDINERMARFAPSQAGPDIDPIAAEIAARASIPSAQPTIQEASGVDPVAMQIATRHRESMNAAVLGARSVNPDEATRAEQLGQRIGIGPEIARADMARAEQQAYLMDLRAKDYPRTDPILANYLENRQFAETAHDDLGVLEMVQPLFMEAAMIQARGAPALFDAVSRGYQRGKKQMELGEMQALQMVRYPTPQERDDMANLTKEIQELGRGGAIGTGAEMIGQYAANLKEIAAYSTAGAAIGSVVPGAGTAAGGALGLAAGLLKTTGTTAAGKLYNTLYEKGVPDDVAIPAAIAGGFFSGLVEVVGGKIAVMPVQSLAKRVMAETLSEALARPTLQQAAKEFVKAYGLQVGGETFEEGTQAISDMLSEEIALAASGIDSELTLRQGFMTVIESALYGAAGSAILGGIGPGANLLVDLRRASNSERQQKFFEGLTANNKDSRLAQRSPVGYERFLAAQADGTNAETIYVDGRIAQQVLAQSGVPVAQLEEIIPGIRERIAEAVETGGDVTIPTARFGAKLANTDLGNALLPHMRLSPDAMSATESQEFATRRQEVVREAEQILAQKQETDATFVQQARQIEDTLTSQIVATGQIDERAARSSAQFMRDFYVTQAVALGISPQEVYERFPVRVQGEQVAAAASVPFEQAARPEVTIEGRTIPVTIAPRDSGVGRELIAIDTGKLDAAWLNSQTEFGISQYIGEGGTGAGEITPERYARFGEFQKTASNIEASVVDVDNQGRVSFQNGRHRFAYMRDKGVTSIPVVMDAESRANAQKFGYIQPPSVPQQPAPVLEQAAAGPARGGFDPSRLTTILNKTADLSTFLHESAHAFLTFYEQISQAPNAPARIVNDMDELLRWFGIAGATPAERIANWNGMSLDQKRKYHETFAYNFEVYLFEGKAPSAEMQGMFERFGAWLKRVYKSIRDDLNAIYRREFGEDLPILTGEVRQVMDRMLATDEQIKRQAAINEMKPQFQTQEKTGMDDAEWAAYQAMQQEAIEASITDMNKASMRQLQWLGNARSRILRDMQKKHEAKRKEVAAEVAAAVRVEPLYRAMTYLRTGKFIDTDGAEVVVEGPHRLDIKRVQAIYAGLPSEKDMEAVRATGQAMPKVFAPDIAKLGTGKYGMLGVDGLDPDVVAESFGYSSGDQMIRALLEAKPIKEAVAERTDAEMLRQFGDMNTPEAQEAEVQKALHNEARARMIAVELRWRSKATQPVRVMLEAAKQVARELIAGMTLRDVRPGDFIAAEARAARDASRMEATVNPEAVGQAAQTRAYNEAIAAGTDPAEAMAAAIEKGAEAARKAQERSDALKAQYGADPQQALVRASRAQLYQNQLAAQALMVREEVAKQVKYLRRIMRDTNVKAMGAQAADQIAALLERFEVAPVSLKRLDERKALAEWLAQQAELGLVPDIAPEIVNEARRVNYQQLTVAEFRDLVDAIRQIEHIGKRERNAAQEKLRAEFNALKDEAVQSMKDVADKRGRKARKELGDEDRKWSQLIAGYDAMQQTIGNIVYVLDGGQRDGPLARMLLFTANDAGNQEATDRANATLALSKILDPIKRKGQFSARKLYFQQIDDSLSLEQRMVIALNYGNQSNIDRLLNGEKWTDEQVQVILRSLTEEQLNAVQAIWDYLQSFKPRVSAQERNLLGRDPNWIELRPFTVRSADGKVVNMAGGYYPAKYNPRRSSMSREMDESVEADRQMHEAKTAATTTRSYTKNRQNRPPEGGVLSRQMSGLYAGINEVIHDLAWRTWAMDANRLLRDKEFQTVINSIYGRETYSAIKNWVDATVRGERGNHDVIENIAIGVRRNVSVSAMGLKFVTAAIQVTGLIPATVRTGITPMVRAVAYFAANPRKSSSIAREKSSFMRNRGKTRYRDLNEIANIVRGESRARRAYLANAYALIGLQQGMVDMSVWWAAYSKAIKEGKAEDMAVSIADQTVIDTQGSGMLKDLSQAMRGGQKQSAYAKLFTSFYQFSNTQYSLLSAQLRTAPSMGKAAADAFTILVVGAFFEEMLRWLLKPSPEDEDPEDLAKALIANQIDFVIGLPFGGGELRGIGDMVVGEQAMQYRGPSGLRMVGEAKTFAGQTLQGEFDRAWTRSAINMSGLIWGIPSSQINDTIDGIEAAVESEVEGVEAVMAPITGVRRSGKSKK